MCKDCNTAAASRYYWENAERVKETVRDYQRRNREVVSAKSHARYIRNAEAIAEKNRAIRSTPEHKEWARDYWNKWRKENADKVREYQSRYFTSDKGRRQSRACAHRRRSLLHGAGPNFTRADIAAQRTRQKGRCFWCGEKVGVHYHVDHVVPLALGGSNGPENLVIACAPCNLSKGAKHPMEWAGILC